MEYLRVKWQHHHPDEPIVIYSEINQDRWEVRKVEVFQDGTSTYASPLYHTGDTWLAESQLPEMEEINTDSQFKAECIARHDFERIWLVSTEMITLHEPQLLREIQTVIKEKKLDVNEFVVQAIQRYLEADC
ncbi:MAG: hypothetical protein Q3M30_12860 [Candidatus Electrothrix sp. Rat3]|nr:hypothetical protein [Candidatus Electrothrix rattekaaiensis]